MVVRWRGGRLTVSAAHGCLLHRLQVAMFEVVHAGDGEVEIVGARPLHPRSVSMCWG